MKILFYSFYVILSCLKVYNFTSNQR